MSILVSRRHASVVASLLVLACACGKSPVDAREDVCPQTYEFGNYGCARVLLKLLGPDGGPVAGPIVHVTLTPLDSAARAEFLGDTRSVFLPENDPAATRGRFVLSLTRMFRPPPIGRPDTVTARVRGFLLDNPANHPTGVRLPTLAADSVDRRLVVVPVGARALVDTIELVLRRP